jgi:hypothetical protein
MLCSACHRASGVALRADVGLRHGSVDVIVHCTQCRHEWVVELPNRRHALAPRDAQMSASG